MSIGIDLGVTQTKVYVDGTCRKFDSLVAEPTPYEAPHADSFRGIEITRKERLYYVGEKAAFDGEAANYPVRPQALDVKDDIRWCAALAAVGQKGPLSVVTGLPVFEYSTLKGALIEHLTGKWEFEFNGQTRDVEVASVTVIPQGAGAYYASILNPEGKLIEEQKERVHGKILVLDLGGRTLNAVTMQGGKFRANGSFTLFRGMVNVYNRLRKLILREYGLPISVYTAGVALRSGTLMQGTNPTDLTDLITRTADPVWTEIQDGLDLEIPDWRGYQEVLLAGASGFFQTQFEEFFEGVPVTLLENAEFANVRGYGAYGALQQSRVAPVQPRE